MFYFVPVTIWVTMYHKVEHVLTIDCAHPGYLGCEAYCYTVNTNGKQSTFSQQRVAQREVPIKEPRVMLSRGLSCQLTALARILEPFNNEKLHSNIFTKKTSIMSQESSSKRKQAQRTSDLHCRHTCTHENTPIMRWNPLKKYVLTALTTPTS